MSYTVKIVDNDTGNVIADHSNVVCIIGAFGREDGTHQLSAACCSGFVMCKTVNAAEDAILSLESDSPKLKPARMLMRCKDSFMGANKDDNDSEDS
jgi:hypothetical protein